MVITRFVLITITSRNGTRTRMHKKSGEDPVGLPPLDHPQQNEGEGATRLSVRGLVVDGPAVFDLHGREVGAVQALRALAPGDGGVTLPKEIKMRTWGTRRKKTISRKFKKIIPGIIYCTWYTTGKRRSLSTEILADRKIGKCRGRGSIRDKHRQIACSGFGFPDKRPSLSPY